MTDGSQARRKRVPLAGCVFCGGRPLSGEHGLPEWLRTLAGFDFPARVVVSRDDQVVHEKDAPAFSQKFRVPCVPCNTGWMHDLEEAVKADVSEMVWGRSRVLTSRTQRFLATWLVKTCCVLQYVDIEPGENIPRAHYEQLYERRTHPPDWCQVWLGRAQMPSAADRPHISEHRCERINIETGTAQERQQEWWFGTLRVGVLMLQVRGCATSDKTLVRPYLGNRVVQIWPVMQHAVRFPSSGTVTFQDMLPAALGQLSFRS